MKYILSIGLNDRITLKQEIPTNTAMKLIVDAVLRHCGGGTITTGTGIFTNADNVPTVETSVQVTIYADNADDVRECAFELVNTLNQECIYIEAQTVESTAIEHVK